MNFDKGKFIKRPLGADNINEDGKTGWEIVKTKGATEAWEARTARIGRYAISVC